jgi:lysophospholipase L1-like esterase
MMDIRICFMGDSFVNGTGDETALGWTGRLCALAHASGVPITGYNLGIRRDTSRDILSRWENECVRRLPDTCDARMVVSCGANDTMIEHGQIRVCHDESLENVRQILRAASGYKLLMVGPPPVGDDAQNDRISVLSEGFSRVARMLNVSYIGLYAPLVSDADYVRDVAGGDGAHPGSKGYEKMARIIKASPSWWFHAA